MSRAVGSWITATGLKKFDPVVLRDALLTDKTKIETHGIPIPLDLDNEKLDLARLADYFHKKHDSHVLEEALFCSIKLDSEEGWRCVEEQICKINLTYQEPEGLTLSNASRCLLAWLNLKDACPYLLEKSYGRLQTASPFTLHLFPLHEVDKPFKSPTPKKLKETQDLLADYYGKKTGRAWCRINHYDGYDDEEWFMIRYPGNIECRPVLEGDHEKDDANNPLFFHTVVYDKKNRLLRTTIKTTQLCAKVRTAFGWMLFDDGNAFEASPQVLSSLLKLDKISKNWEWFSKTNKEDVIQNIRLVRLSCKLKRMGEMKSMCYFGSNDHLPVCEGNLFEEPKQGKNQVSDVQKSPVNKLLEATQYVFWMQLSYDLVTDDGLKRRERKVTIKQGNILGFEQDSGAIYLLDLLYEKKILETSH